MRHLIQIQSEFIKIARKWDDLSLEEQKGYLSRHPATKRKLTAKPKIETHQEEKVEQDDQIDQDTPVQSEIIKACEPLLTYIVSQAKTYYNRVIENFEKQKLKNLDKVDIRKYLWQYANGDSNTFDLLYSVFKTDEHGFVNLKNYKLDESRKEAYFKRAEAYIRDSNLFKLKRVMHRYINEDFTKISNIRVQRGTQGFEISATLKDNQNREWTFNTRAIPAGGYNIQEFHYRYIVNLSSPEVPSDVVRRKITEAERAEKEKRREQRSVDKRQREKEKKAKFATNTILGLKKVVKDWNESGHNACRDQVTRGIRSQADYDDIEKSIGRISRFLNEKDVMYKKRPEIFNQAEHDNISYNYFDSIKDLLEQHKPFVFTPDWDYRNLKRMGQ